MIDQLLLFFFSAKIWNIRRCEHTSKNAS